MALYLAIDLGTTGCRSILFDEKLNMVSSSYEEYPLITPKEKWTEQDAELWWTLTLKTAKNAIARSGVSSEEIKAISVSSQGITIVPVDRDVRPLCNALSWLDVRAEEETARIEKDLSAETVYRVNGKPLSATYTLPKLLWIKAHLPEVYEKAYKFLMPMDFLIARMTGKCVTDPSMASGTLMYDLKAGVWSREILDLYGIDEEKLPTLAHGGECVGRVLPDFAAALGLSPHCVVAVGAQDQKCAALAAGLADGVMTVSLGTAAAITKRWTEAHTERNNGIGWCGYAEKGVFVTEGVIGTAGTCLRWVRDVLFPTDSYVTIDDEALAARERGSSLLFHPYMNGPTSPELYPESTGNFYGINLATERGDIALAVMEGIAFQMRAILETMEAYGNVRTLVLFGGGAKSDLWCQIISDVTGMNVGVTVTPEAAGAGAAVLAAKAAGDSLPSLAIGKTYEPSALKEAYEEKYKRFCEIKKKLWGEEAAR
ncbi:MAG: hypothetical protein J6R89_03425 [Clostridia bacterium]|nr:hypothetical protein [Clostridia bacterium]